MKSILLPLAFGLNLLCANSIIAQQRHETDADTDEFLQREDVNHSQAFSWSSLTENTWNRSRPGGAFVGTNFYLIGGELELGVHGVRRAKTVEIFDGITGTWSSSLVEMTVGVSNIMGSVAAVGDQIYVFGGYDGTGARRDLIQVYDVSTDLWSVHSTALPDEMYGCLAVTIGGGKIFVCGGSTSVGATDSAFVFDPVSGSITPTSPMPLPRYHLTGDNVGDTVYVAAGFSTGTILQSYDVSTDTWTSLPDLPNDRAGCGVMAVGPYCILYGGDWTAYRNDVDVFDSTTGTYDAGKAAALGTMPVGKRAFAYDDFQSPSIRALVAFDGWAGAFLYDCSALF